MISKRIAFVSAISFAVLALFVLSSAEAASPVLNSPFIDPADSRVDGSLPMFFGIEYSDEDGDFPSPFMNGDGKSPSSSLYSIPKNMGRLPSTLESAGSINGLLSTGDAASALESTNNAKTAKLIADTNAMRLLIILYTNLRVTQT